MTDNFIKDKGIMRSALDDACGKNGGRGRYNVIDCETPDVFPGAAVIRVRSTGICGSDLHMTRERHEPQKVSTGHEVAGEIVELPKKYTGRLALGDRVAVEIIGAGRSCGECFFCRFGEFRHCLSPAPDTGGGFSQYMTRHTRGLFKLTDNMDWTDAGLVEPVAVAVHGLRFGDMQAGDVIAVVGSSTIGLASILVARAFGASKVIASARYPHQKDAAVKMGADIVVSDEPGELEEACRESTDARGADTVVETIGGHNGKTLNQAIDCARNVGKVIVLGGFRQPVNFDFLAPMLREVRLLLPVCYSNKNGRHDFESAIDLLTGGDSPYRSIVTHRFELDDIQKGFDIADDKSTGSIKVHITQN